MGHSTTADGEQSTTNSLASSYETRKRNAAVLAGHYSTEKRAMEIVSIVLAYIVFAVVIRNIMAFATKENSWILVLSLLLSMVLSDVFSGLVHWGADTWGSLDTPLLGKTIIRSFREHHLDPMAITRHDYIEANGDSHMVILIPLAFLGLVSIENNAQMFMVCFLASTAFWVSLTNQFHKWAHMNKPPAMIAALQEASLILSRKNHQVHHHNPFDRYYCITTGWLNPILGSFGFWKRMESMITNVTGEVPREDDRVWTAQ